MIATKNSVDHIITFIAGKIEEIKMPVDKVDVIISEWMWRRVMPIIKMAGIEDSEWVNEKLNFWNDVYGFNMDLMKKGFLSDGQVDFADPLSIVLMSVQLSKSILGLQNLRS
ncbi:hypothetical protein BASA81_017952 [Batrachochytrium salamandrivorans]|nr:hypothetical protein BASA81_017952 [Batrachochytrium salamandrivorans]